MSALRSFLNWAEDNRWIWSALAVLAFWGLLSVITNRFSIASLSGILLSASFLTVVGIGQMFVVTTGRGNIDLSIASVVTLSAYLALLTVHGQDANLGWGILAAIALGLVVGLFNSALVVGLRVPAIISTLATGYVLATATLLSNRAISGFAVSPEFETGGRRPYRRRAGYACCLLDARRPMRTAASFHRVRTDFGAVGQNRDGGEVDWDPRESHRCFDVRHFIGSRIANGTRSSGAYVGGAFLEMGQSYFLQSVAAVVVGGTLIFGGSASAIGVFCASVLLILIRISHADHATAPRIPRHGAGDCGDTRSRPCWSRELKKS